MNFDITKHNVGNTDRMIRGIIGALLIISVFRGGSLIVGAIGAILLVTAYLRYCPTYALFNISTNQDPVNTHKDPVSTYNDPISTHKDQITTNKDPVTTNKDQTPAAK